MRGRAFFVGVALVATSLSGCHHRDEGVAAPVAAIPSDTTLTGSQTGDGGPVIYPVAIDGKFLGLAARDWAETTAVEPGAHDIQFGIALPDNAFAYGTLTTALKPDGVYVLRASPVTPVTAQCSAAEGWIETKDGHPASARVVVMIAASGDTESTSPNGDYVRSWTPANCPAS